MSTTKTEQRTREREDSARVNGAETPPPAEAPLKVIGRFLEGTNGSAAPSDRLEHKNGHHEATPALPPVALFCHEPQNSFIGGHVAQVAKGLARRGRRVHLFTRLPFAIDEKRVKVHEVGATEPVSPSNPEATPDLIEQVQQFARRASNAFMAAVPVSEPVAVVGYEWSSAPVLTLLKGLRNLPTVLSLHSLERQRSDLSSPVSRKIVEIETEGMLSAATLLLHDPATLEVARQTVPAAVDRVQQSRPVFPVSHFEADLDPGAIKARYQVGPVDPMLLFVGDLSERYGPDALLKAMPAILRHHPQARLVIVGDGDQFWPLKVYTRYLLLEHAVRLIGHLQGQALHELVQAADMVVVPSREATPWWPIQAAWAARRPVVATHHAAKGLLEHEKDSVLVYPSENSVVWGVERVLYDEVLRKSLGEAGRAKLEARFGFDTVAEQVDELLAALQPSPA